MAFRFYWLACRDERLTEGWPEYFQQRSRCRGFKLPRLSGYKISGQVKLLSRAGAAHVQQPLQLVCLPPLLDHGNVAVEAILLFIAMGQRRHQNTAVKVLPLQQIRGVGFTTTFK